MPFNRLDHSVLGEIRPRFKLKIPLEPELALEQIDKKLTKDKTVSGGRSGQVFFLKIPSWERHYWSPEMSVRVEVEEFTDYTTVSCLVGPRQTVWAMFLFMHAAIALISMFGGIYGIVKYNESGVSDWLWIIPVGVILSASIFITSKIGQHKGRDQMLHLVSFVYHSLDEITEVERLER